METSIRPALIDRIVRADEALDAAAFVEVLAPNATFQIGAQPPVEGKAAIEASVRAFFTGLRELRHDIHDVWDEGSNLIYTAVVHYALADGRRFSLPYANVLSLGAAGVERYRIFIDLSPLHA